MSRDSDHLLRSEHTRYPDGTLKTESQFKGTVQHGFLRQWHGNGQLASEIRFENDRVAPGVYFTWFPNGSVQSEQTYTSKGLVSVVEFGEVSGRVLSRWSAADSAKVLRGQLADASRVKRKKLRPDPEKAAAHDALCQGQLTKSPRSEARSWLAASGSEAGRSIGEFDPSTSRTLVEGLYLLGAQLVHIVHAEPEPTIDRARIEQSSKLIVGLPAADLDPDARARLFAFEAAVARQTGFDPQPDYGQRCMFLHFT